MTLKGILIGHSRLFAAIPIGIAAFFIAPSAWTSQTRGLLSWDVFGVAYLLFLAWLMFATDTDRMEERAEAQQEGEWTLFWLVVLGATASFVAIIGEFGSMKTAVGAARDLKVGLVAATLFLSWFLLQTVFALRYAHEYYQRSGAETAIDAGLEFPSDDKPDYLDFMYFSVVLGMTFQVSDVQISSRKLRRLALAHGLLGFLFNTVIIALTVNLASGLLS